MKKLIKKMLEPEFLELQTFNQTLQELAGIDWSFMDRAYAVANAVVHETRFDVALSIFRCLRYLNPKVFEYSLGEASCLFELGDFEGAFDMYTASLVLEPKNPLCLFQIANCLYQLQDLASCLEALKLCIKYTKDNPAHEELLKNATEILNLIEKHITA